MILILVFRSVGPRCCPSSPESAGVGVSILAVSLLSHVITLPTVAPNWAP